EAMKMTPSGTIATTNAPTVKISGPCARSFLLQGCNKMANRPPTAIGTNHRCATHRKKMKPAARNAIRGRRGVLASSEVTTGSGGFLDHDLHPAVGRSTFRRGVLGDRIRLTHADRLEAIGVDAARDQEPLHRIRARLGEPLIRLLGSGRIRMSLDD